MLQLAPDTWESIICSAWDAVRDRVETKRDLEFAHEHTLQFHFAWEVARMVQFSDNLQVRFEIRSIAPEPRGVIQTDLMFWTNPDFRIAVEVKAPIRSESGANSAMTHGRMAFYKDIDRLRYLVEDPTSNRLLKKSDSCFDRLSTNGKSPTILSPPPFALSLSKGERRIFQHPAKVQRGVFLAVVNEIGYVAHGQQWKNLEYRTFQETHVEARTVIAATSGRNGCLYPLEMPCHPIEWIWECENKNGRVVPRAGFRHFWLKPIAILPREGDMEA